MGHPYLPRPGCERQSACSLESFEGLQDRIFFAIEHGREELGRWRFPMSDEVAIHRGAYGQISGGRITGG
jgi:hypothetical protein